MSSLYDNLQTMSIVMLLHKLMEEGEPKADKFHGKNCTVFQLKPNYRIVLQTGVNTLGHGRFRGDVHRIEVFRYEKDDTVAIWFETLDGTDVATHRDLTDHVTVGLITEQRVF
jgi:hypothetical protein